jgi:predicted transcriptional regulator YdeE
MKLDVKKAVLCATGLVLTLAATVGAGGTLKPSIVEKDVFLVIGIEARTSNAKEMTSERVIPRQWDRFFKEGILDRIPSKTGSSILALYTDYARDKNGDYTYLLGAKVSDASMVPEGMVLKRVPKSRYAVFTTEKGPAAKVVLEAWQEIWSFEDQGRLGGQRAYRADFEVYDQRSRDPQDSQVDIYVGLR